MRYVSLFNLLLLVTILAGMEASAQQPDSTVPRVLLRVSLINNAALNPQQPGTPPVLLAALPPPLSTDAQSPISWNQPQDPTNQPRVRSGSTGLGWLLGGLGVAAAGGFLVVNSYEEKTFPVTCVTSPCPPLTSRERNNAKFIGGVTLTGAGIIMAIKGIRAMR